MPTNPKKVAAKMMKRNINIREIEKELNSVGVSLFGENGEIKSTYAVLEELTRKYKEEEK